jgi:protein-tyrosine phosphatase
MLEQIGILGAVTTVPGYADLRVKRDGGYAHFQLNRFAYPENIGDVVQYCSWLERTKMALRLEGTRSRATANYGGVRPAVRHYLEVIRYKLWGFQRFRNINWAQVKRVVFVCKGNICRSPYAEARAQKFGIEVASAGLTARSGAAANGAAMANAALRDVDIAQHRSRRMDDLTVGKGDLLVAMEPWQGDALLRTFRQSGAQTTLLGFWALPARPYIHDPYGHDEEYFQTCFSVIDMAVDRLMGRVVASETEPVGA